MTSDKSRESFHHPSDSGQLRWDVPRPVGRHFGYRFLGRFARVKGREAEAGRRRGAALVKRIWFLLVTNASSPSPPSRFARHFSSLPIAPLCFSSPQKTSHRPEGQPGWGVGDQCRFPPAQLATHGCLPPVGVNLGEELEREEGKQGTRERRETRSLMKRKQELLQWVVNMLAAFPLAILTVPDQAAPLSSCVIDNPGRSPHKTKSRLRNCNRRSLSLSPQQVFHKELKT